MRNSAFRSCRVWGKRFMHWSAGSYAQAADHRALSDRHVKQSSLNPPPTIVSRTCSKVSVSMHAMPSRMQLYRSRRICTSAAMNISWSSGARGGWRQRMTPSTCYTAAQPSVYLSGLSRTHAAAVIPGAQSCWSAGEVWAPRQMLGRLYTVRAAAASPAAAAAAAAAADSVQEALPPEVEAALPRYCAGCGIRLQRDDPDAPGCVA